MDGLRPHFEGEFKLPGDSRGEANRVFMFSFDGYLAGNPLTRCLLAGEVMLVQGTSLKTAERMCKEGLQDTRRFAREEFDKRPVIELPGSAANEGLTIEGGGNRVRPADDAELLKSDPLMRRILATEIGKLPWKH